MKSFSGQSWQIELQCPQCGAPAVLEECDRLLSCAYCRVKLYLTCKDYFSYFLPPANPSREDLFCVPYWRFRGMAFSCVDTAIRQKVIDSSILALPPGMFPLSLGLRPQALRLRFVSPGLKWTFLPPRFSFKSFMAKLGEHIHMGSPVAGSSSSWHHTFVGETVSLIYTPFYVHDQVLYDAVIEEPLASLPRGGIPESPSPLAEREGAGAVGFVPTLCPHCGWDLAEAKDSLVCLCKNCESAWQLSSDGLQQLDFAVVASDLEMPFYLPFWKVDAELSGIELQSHADLAKLANLPQVIKEEWREEPISFWFPAFKINPKLFLRLGRLLTLAQPGRRLQQALPAAANCHPVTLPVAEAAEAIKLAIASVGVPKRLIFPKLGQIDERFKGHSLVYIPFTAGPNELIQPELQLSINSHALQWGRLL